MSQRKFYDQELEQLHNSLLDMGMLVEQAIEGGVRSLTHKDYALARKVIEGDDAIDALRGEIEYQCMMLIARQQPLAKDLRTIFAAAKIVTDLERVADQAADIAHIALGLEGEDYIKPLVGTKLMSKLAIRMVHDCLDAYVQQDIELARAVCETDDEVDGMFLQICRELMTYAMQDTKSIGQVIQFVLVIKYLERIADHATNIAEWTIYNVTGEHPELN